MTFERIEWSIKVEFWQIKGENQITKHCFGFDSLLEWHFHRIWSSKFNFEKKFSKTCTEYKERALERIRWTPLTILMCVLCRIVTIVCNDSHNSSAYSTPLHIDSENTLVFSRSNTYSINCDRSCLFSINMLVMSTSDHKSFWLVWKLLITRI